jgi:hypothetical protein
METIPQRWPESGAVSPLAEGWTPSSARNSKNQGSNRSGGVGALVGVFFALLQLLALCSLLTSVQVRSIVQIDPVTPVLNEESIR